VCLAAPAADTGDCADQAALRTHAEELILAGGEWALEAVRALGVKHCIAQLALPTFTRLLVLAEGEDVVELREHVRAGVRNKTPLAGPASVPSPDWPRMAE